MNTGVNFLIFPDGKRLVTNPDDTAAKSEALRLGLLSSMTAKLGEGSGARGVAGLARDGDKIVAVIGLAGFELARNNHWYTLSMSPFCEETAGFLSDLAYFIVGADSTWIEGDES